MTRSEENISLMFAVALAFLKQNAKTTATLPDKFAPLQIDFAAAVPIIFEYRDKLSVNIKTLTANKKKARAQLENKLVYLDSRLRAYANVNDQAELSAAIKYTKSSISHMNESELLGVAYTIYSKTNTNIVALEKYKILPATLIELKALMDSYKLLQETKAISTAERKILNNKLSTLIKTSTVTLKKIDLLINVLDSINPDFVAQYKLVRKVKAVPSIPSMVQLKFVNSNDSSPIEGVKAAFTLQTDETNKVAANNSKTKTIKKKSAKKGNFRIKSLQEGTYILNISAPSFSDETITIDISKDNPLVRTISLKPNTNTES